MMRLDKLGKELLLLVGGFLLIGIAVVVLRDETSTWGESEEPIAQIDMLSYANEASLGKLFMELYLSDEIVIEDSLLEVSMNVITNRLIDALDTIHYNYHFYVIQQEEANAFTLPGGHIVVHSGLIETCDAPEKLAAVLSHELGHAQMRHVVDRMMTELGLSVTLSVLSGGDPGVIHELSKWLLSNVFSRVQEREADAFALALLEKASIEPAFLGQFFEKVDEQNVLGFDVSWFSTHPGNEERIASGKAYQTAPGFVGDSIRVDWRRVQQRISDI